MSKMCGEKQGFILSNSSSFQLHSENALLWIQRGFDKYRISFSCSQRQGLCSSLPLTLMSRNAVGVYQLNFFLINSLNFWNCPFQWIHTCACGWGSLSRTQSYQERISYFCMTSSRGNTLANTDSSFCPNTKALSKEQIWQN